VHVYVSPEWRGAERGSALLEHALRALRGRGVTHVLTLADDRGSGKLREWYERHGFVDTAQFTETAMVARLL
jgi:GNAT superfamily N-acetyltransferase